MSPQAAQLLVQEIAPRIHSSLGYSPPQVSSDDTAELVQEGIALAARLLHSAEARGKKVSAGNIGYYATKLVRQGRRSTGLSKTDVMHPATQIHGRAQVMSLDEPLGGESESDGVLSLHDIMAAPSADPSQEAARRLDWKLLVAALDATTKEVLVCLASGGELTTLVPKLRRSRSALQGNKRYLARLVRQHLGQDILRQVQELPRWFNNLTANRQRLACRIERQLA